MSPESSRRAFLAGIGTTAMATGLTVGPQAWADPASSDQQGFKPFAMITDTHTNPEKPKRTEYLQKVFAHLSTRDPAFILHCGDVTDTGFADDLAYYTSLVPAQLKPLLHTIPGNHEQQWNGDAMEGYQRLFPKPPYSFDAAGYHVVALDPMVSREEVPVHFGSEQLEWLERDLKHAPHGAPVICFQHFPLGGKWHFVDDNDAFLRLVEPYPVRAIFAGHTHLMEVDRFNGITQVIGGPVKNHATYLWVEPKAGDHGTTLEVTKVNLYDDDGVPETISEASIPLYGAGPGGTLGPFKADASVRGGSAVVNVTVPPHSTPNDVQAQMFPQGGSIPKHGWVPLARSGRSWSGSVDVSSLAPGGYRMLVRAVGDDAVYGDTTPVEIGGATAEVTWTRQLPERIHGSLAERDGLVVAGSIDGGVQAVRATQQSAQPRWRADVGPVYMRSVFTPDGQRVIVPSADHHLYALAAATGRTAWRLDLGAPVLSAPVVTEVDGDHRILVTAGHTLCCVSSDGHLVWSRDLGGVFTGAVACDGDRVFAGSGNGRAYAMDARTGEVAWSVWATDKTGAYGHLNYGAACAHLMLLPDDRVLFGGHEHLRSFDRATGDLVWVTQIKARSAVYTPPLVTDHGIVWFNGRNGKLHLSEVSSGAVVWAAHPLLRSRSAGPIPSSDPDVVWMVGLGGTLIRIDLAGRNVRQVLQVSPAFTYSTAALVQSGGADMIVVGGQDGRLHGITGIK